MMYYKCTNKYVSKQLVTKTNNVSKFPIHAAVFVNMTDLAFSRICINMFKTINYKLHDKTGRII